MKKFGKRFLTGVQVFALFALVTILGFFVVASTLIVLVTNPYWAIGIVVLIVIVYRSRKALKKFFQVTELEWFVDRRAEFNRWLEKQFDMGNFSNWWVYHKYDRLLKKFIADEGLVQASSVELSEAQFFGSLRHRLQNKDSMVVTTLKENGYEEAKPITMEDVRKQLQGVSNLDAYPELKTLLIQLLERINNAEVARFKELVANLPVVTGEEVAKILESVIDSEDVVKTLCDLGWEKRSNSATVVLPLSVSSMVPPVPNLPGFNGNMADADPTTLEVDKKKNDLPFEERIRLHLKTTAWNLVSDEVFEAQVAERMRKWEDDFDYDPFSDPALPGSTIKPPPVPQPIQSSLPDNGFDWLKRPVPATPVSTPTVSVQPTDSWLDDVVGLDVPNGIDLSGLGESDEVVINKSTPISSFNDQVLKADPEPETAPNNKTVRRIFAFLGGLVILVTLIAAFVYFTSRIDQFEQSESPILDFALTEEVVTAEPTSAEVTLEPSGFSMEACMAEPNTGQSVCNLRATASQGE